MPAVSVYLSDKDYALVKAVQARTNARSFSEATCIAIRRGAITIMALEGREAPA